MIDCNIIIDLDVDGVCGNIMDDEFVRSLIGDLIPNYSEEMLRRYNLADIKEASPEADRRIRESFCDVDHLLSMPRYEGVEAAVRHLSKCGLVVFHTLIIDEKAVPARAAWIESLIRDAGIESECSVQIDVKQKMKLYGADILIEDNPAAFSDSDALLKICILHPYNRDNLPKDVVPVKNLSEAADYCEWFLRNAGFALKT